MKKSLIYIIIALFLWSSCAFAIDKTTSKKELPDKPDTNNTQPVNPPADKTDNNSKAGQNQGTTNKDYNDFVDGNNNGVDDRMETSKNKSSSKETDTNK